MRPNDVDASLTAEQTKLNAVPEKDRTAAQKARLVAIAAELDAQKRLAHTAKP